MWQRFIDHQVRLWIRRHMASYQLARVFETINEEYRRVYSEDNFFTRQNFLHELVDSSDPDSYKWGNKQAHNTKKTC